MNKISPFKQIKRSNITPQQFFIEDYSSDEKLEEKKEKRKKFYKNIKIAGALTLAAVYGVKKYNVNNIKNIRKAFEEVFLRDDITIEKAREMLNEYKNVQAIEDINEYAEALFKLAKKNYGMENRKIKLDFKPLSGHINGECARDNSEIRIDSNSTKYTIFRAIHHELRHAKQHEIVYNEYPEYAKDVISNSTSNSFLNDLLSMILPVEERIEQNFGTLSPNNVPEKYKEFARKTKESIENYVDSEDDMLAYWKNFSEKDARRAENKMDKYVNSWVFGFEWASDIEVYTRNICKRVKKAFS